MTFVDTASFSGRFPRFYQLARYEQDEFLHIVFDNLSGQLVKAGSLKNLLQLDGYYVLAEGKLLDKNYREMYLSYHQIQQSENDFLVTFSDRYNLFYKNKAVELKKFDYRLASLGSPYFQALTEHIVFLPALNIFLQAQFTINGMECYGELLRVLYSYPEGQAWMYLNKKGKIVYNSDTGVKPKLKRLSWKKMRKTQ